MTEVDMSQPIEALVIPRFDAFKRGGTKYTPDMPMRLMESMDQGKGIIESCTDLGILVETLYDWTDPNSTRFKPELALSLKIGRQIGQNWWLEQARNSLRDNTFNHVLWYMNMKNRYGWRDQVDLTSDGQPIQFTNTVPRPQLIEQQP